MTWVCVRVGAKGLQNALDVLVWVVNQQTSVSWPQLSYAFDDVRLKLFEFGFEHLMNGFRYTCQRLADGISFALLRFLVSTPNLGLCAPIFSLNPFLCSTNFFLGPYFSSLCSFPDSLCT